MLWLRCKNARMDVLPPYRFYRKIHWETPSDPTHSTAQHWCRRRLRDVHKSWQTFCQRGFRHVWQRLLNKERTRLLEWFAAGARRATRFFRAELWINYPNKNRPRRSSSDLTSLTADGSWQLHRKSACVRGKKRKLFPPGRPQKVKRREKVEMTKSDDLMRDSPRFALFTRCAARKRLRAMQTRVNALDTTIKMNCACFLCLAGARDLVKPMSLDAEDHGALPRPRSAVLRYVQLSPATSAVTSVCFMCQWWREFTRPTKTMCGL